MCPTPQSETRELSYDFELYVSRTCSLNAPATSDSSTIRVDGPDRAEDEDIPDSYLSVIGKKRLLYRIHLEGELTAADHETVDAWLADIVSTTKGVLIDQQTERFETTTQSGLLAPLVQPPSSGWMSFYFEDGEAFYQNRFEHMLQEISRRMPEAVPTRFGTYEPLQGKVEAGNVAGLISSFKNEPDTFMKAKAPFGHIFVSIPCKKTFEQYHPRHFIRREFLLARVSFELRPKLFAQPAKLDRLRSLFTTLSVMFDVVYAEITQTDDFGSWFWYGLPDHQTHTICLGKAYQGVWPEALETGHKVGDHHHLVTTDRFGNKPPCPPNDLVAPPQKGRNPGQKPEYAPVFPFDYVFDYKTYIW